MHHLRMISRMTFWLVGWFGVVFFFCQAEWLLGS